MLQDQCSSGNKTGLQPVSRPVEQIVGFYPKGLKVHPKGLFVMQIAFKGEAPSAPPNLLPKDLGVGIEN